MQLFLKLFGRWLQFHDFCFDRIVVNGYLRAFFQESSVVCFFLRCVQVRAYQINPSKFTKQIKRAASNGTVITLGTLLPRGLPKTYQEADRAS